MARSKKKKGSEITKESFGDQMINSLTQKNLIETERFIKRLEIQTGIIKKIIPPTQDSPTNKNKDK